MEECFYRAGEDGSHVSTSRTAGPWSHEHQHAGPPAALLARALERCEPQKGLAIARVTVEILRPIPVAPLRAQARVVRPGRSVALLEGELADADGQVMLARAWRIATGDVDLPAGLEADPAAPPLPGAESAAREFFPTAAPGGYHTAVEWRFDSGSWLEMGPATVWSRMRIPLVEGEEPTPLQRTLVVADSGSGISATLDPRRYLFINTDLTLHVRRSPAGEWIGMESVTHPEGHGHGLTDTRLFDAAGTTGRALQSLLVREREAG